MGWKEKMKDFGGGAVDFLTEDGEAITFVVAGEPELMTGQFKGKPSERIGAPIMTLEGVSVLVLGKRIARRLSKHEEHFDEQAYTIVRRGEQGDINSTYELSVCPDIALTEKLLNLRNDTLNEQAVIDAFEDARSIIED